jgi:hypothetical protein
MMKQQLLSQTLHIGEVYSNHGALYRVESFDDDVVRGSVHLRRIKDGWELDARGAALYLTERGVELQWDYSLNGQFTTAEDLG